jgi:hypothetical protein
MSRPCYRACLATALGAISLLAGTTPAGAGAPELQSFDGTLQFCGPACDLGTLTAVGPIAGTATIEIISDRPNHRFSVTQAQVRLTLDGTDTVTLAITLRSSDGDVSGPCRVEFNEDGRWRIIDGTGRYADLQGEGLLHNDGLAIDHDPQCPGTPYSSIDWHLTGRAHRRSN